MTDTNPRHLIQRMAEELDLYREIARENCWAGPTSTYPLADQARAYLAQLEPGVPTEEEIKDWHSRCADLTRLGEAEHYWAFDLDSDKVADVVSAALARWGK